MLLPEPMRAEYPGPYEQAVNLRFEPKEKVVLTLDWSPPNSHSDLKEQIAFEIEWISLPAPQVEIFRPFLPPDR